MNPFRTAPARRAVCALAAVGAAFTASSSHAGVILQDNWDRGVGLVPQEHLGQTFTAIDTEILYVGLGLGDFGNPFHDPSPPPLAPFTLELYSGAGFGGSLLASETIAPAALTPDLDLPVTNTPLQIYSLPVSGLTLGATYTLALLTTGPTRVMVNYQHHGADPYAGGQMLAEDGSLTQDLAFMVIGDTPVTPCPVCDCPPGLGDPPAGGVPEPASWALMILGFGGAGAMLRRRDLSRPRAC